MFPAHTASAAVLWLGGCASWATWVGPVDTLTAAGGAALCAAAGTLPDIDTATSTISAALLPVPTRVRRAVWALLVDPLTGGHRARTHTYLFAVLAGLVAGLVGHRLGAWWSGPAVGFGCWAHLVGDRATMAGVPLHWPFSDRQHAWRLFKTGGRFETALVTPAFAAAAVVLGWWLLARPFVGA